MAGKEERLNNVPDGTLLNRLFCVEAPQNSDDRRGEITCVISPRGLSVRFGKEEGMKKQKLHFGILLVVCMLCAAAWFLVRYLDLPESEEEEAVEVTVTDFNAEDVTALSTGGEYPLNFVKEDGTWYNAEDRSASIQQSMVENLLTYITHITSETAIEEPDDLSQYGLDEPSMTITATLENGTSVILHIGESNSITGDYYLQVSGDDTVYTVSSSLVSTFEKTPEDFVEEETETEAETEAETETATEN